MTLPFGAVLFIIVYILCSAVHCSPLKYKAGGRPGFFTKPLIVVSLMIAYFSVLKANVSSYVPQAFLCIAMAFYFIGDILMMWPKNKVPLVGAALSFSLGHLFYSAFFLRLDTDHHILWFILAALVAVPFVLVSNRRFMKTDSPLVRLFSPLSLFLMLLVCSSATVLTEGRFGGLLCFAGSCCFVFSDTLARLRAYREPIPRGEWIMIFYCVSQLFTATGLLMVQIF